MQSRGNSRLPRTILEARQTTSDRTGLMHYLLFYEVVDDYVERRAPLRDSHLTLARRAHEKGDLIVGGALANPVDGAVLLFRGATPAVAEEFARADPYVVGGLVRRWYVREWTTVVGDVAGSEE